MIPKNILREMSKTELYERIREEAGLVPWVLALELSGDRERRWHDSEVDEMLSMLSQLVAEWRRRRGLEEELARSGGTALADAAVEDSMRAGLEEWERRGFQTEVSVFGEEQDPG